MDRIKSLIAILLILAFAGCIDKENELNSPEGPEGNDAYLIFGSFYGFCAGDQCVKFFMINGEKLYELDNPWPNQNAPFEPADFRQMSQEEYNLVKDLPSKIPSELYAMEEHILGCPDCADGGGIYLETALNGERKYWYIDNTLNEPEYVVQLIKDVNEKVNLFRN